MVLVFCPRILHSNPLKRYFDGTITEPDGEEPCGRLRPSGSLFELSLDRVERSFPFLGWVFWRLGSHEAFQWESARRGSFDRAGNGKACRNDAFGPFGRQ